MSQNLKKKINVLILMVFGQFLCMANSDLLLDCCITDIVYFRETFAFISGFKIFIEFVACPNGLKIKKNNFPLLYMQSPYSRMSINLGSKLLFSQRPIEWYRAGLAEILRTVLTIPAFKRPLTFETLFLIYMMIMRRKPLHELKWAWLSVLPV